MKKIFVCIFLCFFLFTGCGKTVAPFGEEKESSAFSNEYIFPSNTTASYSLLSCDNAEGEGSTAQDAAVNTTQPPVEQNISTESISSELRGVWLSYYEIDVDNSRNTIESYASYINSLFDLFEPYGITDVFVHVRAYADAMYKSSVYPVSFYAAGEQGGELPFDCLEVICRIASERNVKVHAWVNPYRVYNGTDINELSDDNKAKQWYNENSTEDVVVVGDKIYFNPSSQKARQLVVDGAREIMQNYNVTGVHIDDYFYPPDCGDFDSQQYNSYISSGGTMSLEDWRRDNVNRLVKELYTTVKSFGTDKIFSISPAGNINNNFNSLYADVALWSRGGYADMIIPQIYYGFEHSVQPFEACTRQWLSLRGEGIKMPVGLSLYKAGTEDSYAGVGVNEWMTRDDIIARQVECLRREKSDGFVVFSCEFFDDTDTAKAKELENLRTYLGSAG